MENNNIKTEIKIYQIVDNCGNVYHVAAKSYYEAVKKLREENY